MKIKVYIVYNHNRGDIPSDFHTFSNKDEAMNYINSHGHHYWLEETEMNVDIPGYGPTPSAI